MRQFALILVFATITLSAHAVPPVAPEDEYIRLVPPQQLADWWVLDRESWAGVLDREESIHSGTGCVAISFVIETDGKISHYHELRRMPKERFGDMPQRLADAFRFTAGPKNTKTEAIATYLTIQFHDADDMMLGSRVKPEVEVNTPLRRLCAIDNLKFEE